MTTIRWFLVFVSLAAAADGIDFLNPPDGSNEAIPVAAPGPERIIGTYSGGCILGASPFPVSTKNFELVNTTRNHQYGHSSLIQFVDKLGAKSVAKKWGKLRVGDGSCPCGGKMGVGHSSHRIGLDVDIFYASIPAKKTLSFQERNAWDDKKQEENEIATYEQPVEGKGTVQAELTSKFKPQDAELLREAAKTSEVDRIFVSPRIKRKLCEMYFKEGMKRDSQWLKKIRPWTGHKSHFHVRLKCPASDSGCKSQAPIPEDPTDKSQVGCDGDELAAWFKPKPKSADGEDESAKKPPQKTDAEKQCDAEIAKLNILSPAPGIRCLKDAAELRCRDYESATVDTTKCTPDEIAKAPKACLKNDVAGEGGSRVGSRRLH